jgi:hypothetical protein
MATPRKIPHDVQAYSLYEVGEMLGIERSTIDLIVKERRFEIIPFSILKFGGMHFCSKKQVDKFIQEGKIPKFNKAVWAKHRTWVPGEYTTWTFKVPKTLTEKFKKICYNMNRESPVKLAVQQYRILAIQEFIDRRPEYLGDDEDGCDEE